MRVLNGRRKFIFPFYLYRQFSRVLVYDWSEGGDTEVVIEDIENTELDMIELYSDQQKDWRFHNETNAAQKRFQCTNPLWIKAKLKCFLIGST